MNNFDNLFFRGYIGSDSEIREVFHRHFFVIIEDVIVWIFFGLLIPVFLYSQDIFLLKSSIPEWWSYIYISFIYGIIIYKLFDWYVDVWIMTENTIVDMKWKWFSSNMLYIPYSKIEGIEIRTRSWWEALLGMSDVVVKLAGEDRFTLYNARKPTDIVAFLQEVGKKKKTQDDDKEPFEILVDTLSDVVKGHLDKHGKEYITREYIEKLDKTITRGIPIDLRTEEEKNIIKNWKEKHHIDENEGKNVHNT